MSDPVGIGYGCEWPHQISTGDSKPPHDDIVWCGKNIKGKCGWFFRQDPQPEWAEANGFGGKTAYISFEREQDATWFLLNRKKKF